MKKKISFRSLPGFQIKSLCLFFLGAWSLGFGAFTALAAPQAVYVNADGSIVNTTDFDFKSGKLKVCDVNGANCVAVDSALAGKQPLDSDLTAIAAVTTTAFGRNALAVIDAPAFRTYISAGTSSFDGAFASLSGKPNTIGGYGITDFNSLGDDRWSLLGHTHTFASLTSKPTTIAGYGITDFNALGDARWSLLAHTHTFASLTSKPTTLSGYGITDAEPAIAAGTSSQYWRGDKTFQSLNTAAVPESGNLYYTNARAISAPLTGYVAGAGTITSGDSVLAGIQKNAGNIAAIVTPANTTATASNFFTAYNSTTGAFTKSQPAFTDISGTLSGSSVNGGTFGAVNGSALTALTAANITNSTTVGRNLLNLANPAAITFLQLNADNTVTAQSASAQRTALGATTIGANLFTLANPGAITFPRYNADNTVSSRSAAQLKTDLSLTIGTDVQAWDADLDAVAAFSSTGLAARTGSGAWAQRNIAGTANEITLTNGDGVSGNPTASLPPSLTFTGKTITGGTYSGPTLSGTIAGTPAWASSQAITLASAAQPNITSLKGSTAVAASVYNSANETLTDSTWAILTFDSERDDTDAIHSTSSNTGRLTCTVAGRYHIEGNVAFAIATGVRHIGISLNSAAGSGFIAMDDRLALSGYSTIIHISRDYTLAVNDYVTLQARQDSGGNLDVQGAANYTPEFSMTRIP